MILWMVWATLLGLLFGLAGWLAERTLRSLGRSGRFAWLAAMGASVGLPTWALVRPPAAAAPVAGAATAAGAVRTAGAGLLARIDALLALPPALLRHADPFVIGAWAAASITLTVALTLGLSRLRRRARRWPAARIGGGDALVSEDFGPALLGLRAPRVVIPRWALALGGDRLAMAWAHEDEHRAVGDGWLFLAGAVAVMLAPWNAALWWQVSRLRAAAELDCDARVLRRGFAPAAYGALLLDVGSRSSGLPFPVAALSKPRTLLERRLTMIVNGVRRAGPWATAAALVGVMALVAVACEAPAPTGVHAAAKDGSAETQVKVTGPHVDVTADSVVMTEAGQAGAGNRVVMSGVSNLNFGDTPQAERPLVLLDGKPAALSSIDAKDIRSISVYKGVSATKRYGARAAHGVIVITTKGAGGGGSGK